MFVDWFIGAQVLGIRKSLPPILSLLWLSAILPLFSEPRQILEEFNSVEIRYSQSTDNVIIFIPRTVFLY